MDKAYFWYREHPYFDKFYPGKVLDLITDEKIISKYLADPLQLDLAKKFFPKGLTPHGMQVLINCGLHSDNAPEAIAEIIFELVRQLHFPDAPSRLCSFYASQTIGHAERWDRFWYGCYGPRKGQVPESLWEIRFEASARLYDASFCDVTPNGKFSYLIGLENAYRYWNGEFSKSPMPELLIPAPITISRLIRNVDATRIR